MNHHLISPTAKLVAYMRARTDIPYSAEISRLTDSEKIAQDITNLKDIEWWMAGNLEMRYKSLSAMTEKICAEKKITNILELACGIIPRGIVMTENSKITFIETDLPEMLEEKIQVTKDLGIPPRKNLIQKPLNALDGKAMNDIVDLFPKGPVCIINEGLLPYLNHDEKKILAENILGIIRVRGGAWITPDISTSERMNEIMKLYPEMVSILKNIGRVTGRDMKANSFGGTEEMEKFYRDIGFVITKYEQRDLVPFLSVEDGLTKEDSQKKALLEAILKTSKMWVLTA